MKRRTGTMIIGLVVAATLGIERGATAAGCDLLVSTFGNSKVMRYDAADGTLVGTFVPTGGGGLSGAHSMTFGPDGHLYVASFNNGAVMRYDGQTGANLPGPDGQNGSAQFVTPGSGGLSQASGVAFGPDGNLYVSSFGGRNVRRYNGATGAFIDVFVSTGSGGLGQGELMCFGTDGHLYMGSASTNSVMRYDGATGDPLPGPFGAGGTAQFVPPGSGGLSQPHGIMFGPDGNLYATSFANSRVIRYDGATGALIDVFVTSGDGGLSSSHGVTFGANGNLFAVGFGNGAVREYSGADGMFIGTFVANGVGALSQPADLMFFRACFCPADVNKSGEVDFADLLAILGAWGPCAGCVEDVDGNGEVGFSDILSVLAAWGACA